MIDITTRPKLLDVPTSSYDFLTKNIVDIIREEPKRMWMSVVITLGDDEETLEEDLLGSIDKQREDIVLEVPSCGAIGCIAGWTTMLTDGYYQRSTEGGLDFAARKLGLIKDKEIVMCWGFRSKGGYRNPAEELFCDEVLMKADNQGSPEFAEQVITHINNFARKYEGLLRSHIIQPKRA